MGVGLGVAGGAVCWHAGVGGVCCVLCAHLDDFPLDFIEIPLGSLSISL